MGVGAFRRQTGGQVGKQTGGQAGRWVGRQAGPWSPEDMCNRLLGYIKCGLLIHNAHVALDGNRVSFLRSLVLALFISR